MTTRPAKTVSLVLGSGGARGNAHIGVIRWLLENDYDIRTVSGCSIGALVGGVYAAGKLDEYADWMSALTEREIFRLLDISWQKSGLVKGERVFSVLKELVGECEIEELPIGYTAVAANLESFKEVWIQDGPMFEAIRASVSFPLILTPRQYHGVTVVDGGVLNPVPIAPTFGDVTDLCIAVSLSGHRTNPRKKLPAEEKSNEARTGLRARIEEFVDKLGIGNGDDAPEYGPIDIANQAIDAMQTALSRQKLAAYPPDVLIEIPRNACTLMEFQRADELISIGYELAQEAMEKHYEG